MHRLLLAAVAGATAGSAAIALTASGSPAPRATTLRFDEKATFFKVIDNPPVDTSQAPESGDTVLFRADLVKGTKKIGIDQGFCTVLDAPKAQCTATLLLSGGHITGADAFDFSTNHPQPFALIGGTGRYQGVSGVARIAQVTPALAHWVVTLKR
jgi:hypothetical protein